jgi:hypothetical protein
VCRLQIANRLAAAGVHHQQALAGMICIALEVKVKHGLPSE